MVVNLKDGQIILEWSWGGQLVLSIAGAKQFAQTLLCLIDEAETGQQARKLL